MAAAAVTLVHFAIGLVVAIVLFAGLTSFLVEESRRPVRFPTAETTPRRPLRHSPHVSHARIATVCFFFTVWSLWATARPVSG
jgi:hypothetical protein